MQLRINKLSHKNVSLKLETEKIPRNVAHNLVMSCPTSPYHTPPPTS